MKKILNRLYTIYCKIWGSTIGSQSLLWWNTKVQIYKGVQINKGSTLYKNVTIYNGREGLFKMGNNSHVAPFGYFLIENQKLEIGNDVAIGPNCSFFCISNDTHGPNPLFRKNYTKDEIKIGNNVFIGAQCVFLPGTIVGDNVAVAANSVCRGKLESGYLYGGSPVKKIKKLDS